MKASGAHFRAEGIYLAQISSSWFSQVEAVEGHDFGPGIDKVVNEHPVGASGGVNFRDGAQLAV